MLKLLRHRTGLERAQTANNFRRNSFACGNLSFLAPHFGVEQWSLSAQGSCLASPPFVRHRTDVMLWAQFWTLSTMNNDIKHISFTPRQITQCAHTHRCSICRLPESQLREVTKFYFPRWQFFVQTVRSPTLNSVRIIYNTECFRGH